MENLTPHIGTIENNIYNLGSIVKMATKTFTVKLPKTITSARVGCSSCTKATFTQNELTVTYQALDRKGKEITKPVTVGFEDNTTQKVTFKAKII